MLRMLVGTHRIDAGAPRKPLDEPVQPPVFPLEERFLGLSSRSRT
jgi:hypothetical protein